jgi:acyl carrier protein
MNEAEKKVAAFLRDHLMVDEDNLHPETLIFTDGIVDSFSLMEIIQFVEESEGVEVSDGDVTLENFDSISRIAAYVTRKKKGA